MAQWRGAGRACFSFHTLHAEITLRRTRLNFVTQNLIRISVIVASTFLSFILARKWYKILSVILCRWDRNLGTQCGINSAVGSQNATVIYVGHQPSNVASIGDDLAVFCRPHFIGKCLSLSDQQVLRRSTHRCGESIFFELASLSTASSRKS